MQKELETPLEYRIWVTEIVLVRFNTKLYLLSSKMGHKSQAGLSRVDAHGLAGYCINGRAHPSLAPQFQPSKGNPHPHPNSEVTGRGIGN